MSHSSPSSSHRPPAAAILVVPLVVAIILTLFAWPAAKLEPRDLPVGVAGPAAATGPIEQQLEAREGAFELHRYADEAAAREAIEDRDVYGAFVATPQGPKVLTASAGSQAVAQQLTHAADEAGATVEDVVEAGPQATGLASSVLPLVIAGILVGVVAALAASRGVGRAGLVVAGSVLTGLAVTGIVQGWLDVIGGDWVANAGVLSLTVLAIAATLAGLYAVLGKAGLAIGALTMIFVGNPFSGVGSAPELLPEPAGAIGQLLPPGAGGNLLRSTGFFDGAGGAGHLTVLAVWVLAGLAFLLAGQLRGRRAATAKAASAAA
jgi:ABC-2 family transporter